MIAQRAALEEKMASYLQAEGPVAVGQILPLEDGGSNVEFIF